MTAIPVTKAPALGQAWLGDWRSRVFDRLRARNFDRIEAFAEATPTAPLTALSDELSTDHAAHIDHADVCAEQLVRLWREEAARGGPVEIERMARRLLLGELRQNVPEGWLDDWRENIDSASRLANGMSSWASHVGTEHERAADRVIAGMLDDGNSIAIPRGWLPETVDDPILVHIFAQHWAEPP